ncbi:MAG TPA: glycosyltransferase family 87 protein [Gemmatimonadaceae bacterium]|nr:glycosyltransferase family 87 protein [Gemmatimonadaceae bacterium]
MTTTTLKRSPFSRLSARLAAIPLPRLRRALLALYLLVAAADATGKALATNPRVNATVRDLVGERGNAQLQHAERPSGNFEIFRAASRHLVAGQDLYAEYPAEHTDRFKYSPTFALLFAPLAWIPWPVALFLWSALNALLLFVAVEKVLPHRRALLAMGLLLLEVLRGMQNAQSNALVAALIVLAFAWTERRRQWSTAFAVGLGACVKIFPLAALTFAVPRRRALSTGLAAGAVGVVLLMLPLALLSPAALAAQYASWTVVEAGDAQQRWFSAMELLHRITGVALPNWPLQLLATAALLAPLAIRRERWDDARFRLLYLCSVLLYVVLFNHQAERASYLIAFTGATIWFTAEPRPRWRTALYGLAALTMPVMSTLIPGDVIRTPAMMTVRLALPCLAIWLVIQRELLLRAPRAARSTEEELAASDEPGVEVDLDVAFQR